MGCICAPGTRDSYFLCAPSQHPLATRERKAKIGRKKNSYRRWFFTSSLHLLLSPAAAAYAVWWKRRRTMTRFFILFKDNVFAIYRFSRAPHKKASESYGNFLSLIFVKLNHRTDGILMFQPFSISRILWLRKLQCYSIEWNFKILRICCNHHGDRRRSFKF